MLASGYCRTCCCRVQLHPQFSPQFHDYRCRDSPVGTPIWPIPHICVRQAEAMAQGGTTEGPTRNDALGTSPRLAVLEAPLIRYERRLWKRVKARVQGAPVRSASTCAVVRQLRKWRPLRPGTLDSVRGRHGTVAAVRPPSARRSQVKQSGLRRRTAARCSWAPSGLARTCKLAPRRRHR